MHILCCLGLHPSHTSEWGRCMPLQMEQFRLFSLTEEFALPSEHSLHIQDTFFGIKHNRHYLYPCKRKGLHHLSVPYETHDISYFPFSFLHCLAVPVLNLKASSLCNFGTDHYVVFNTKKAANTSACGEMIDTFETFLIIPCQHQIYIAICLCLVKILIKSRNMMSTEIITLMWNTIRVAQRSILEDFRRIIQLY